jgi:beta-lactamase superfamily II metal-dependent hydrolase
VAGDPDTCDVLLAPHHGSVTSLPPDVATASRPDWVVVSGCGGSRWTEVAEAYARAREPGRAITVVKTSGTPSEAAGAVSMSLSAGGVAVRQFREGRWCEVRPPRPSRVASATQPRPAGRRSAAGT